MSRKLIRGATSKDPTMWHPVKCCSWLHSAMTFHLERFLNQKYAQLFIHVWSSSKKTCKIQWSDKKKKTDRWCSWCHASHFSDVTSAEAHYLLLRHLFSSPLFPSCFLCLRLKREEVRCEERGWGIQDVKNWEMRKGGDVGGLAWSLKLPLLWPNYGLTYELQTDVWTCLHAEESRTRSQSRNKDRKHNDDVIQMLKQITDVGNKVCQRPKEIWVVCSWFFFLLNFLIEVSRRWM